MSDEPFPAYKRRSNEEILDDLGPEEIEKGVTELGSYARFETLVDWRASKATPEQVVAFAEFARVLGDCYIDGFSIRRMKSDAELIDTVYNDIRASEYTDWWNASQARKAKAGK